MVKWAVCCTLSSFSKRSTSAPSVSMMFSPCFSIKFSSSSHVFTSWISCKDKKSTPIFTGKDTCITPGGRWDTAKTGNKTKTNTYMEELVNVLFFQIRPCHHSAVKVNFSLEANFTQPQVSGLHVRGWPCSEWNETHQGSCRGGHFKTASL